MNYPMIMIVGQSGSGKSYSLKDLPKERTAILNVERKILPFKEALKFTQQYDIDKVDDFELRLNKVLDSDTCDVVIIESFTKYIEMLLTQSKIMNKGYDIYNYYNDKITKTLDRAKNNKNKFVIFLAIDERVESISPTGSISTSRRVKVGGKVWEGLIEKEFTVVLFTDVKQEKGKDAIYSFLVNNDGTNSAKSPPDLFKTKQNNLIPNDLNFVIEQMTQYYELSKENKGTESKEKTALPPMQTYV